MRDPVVCFPADFAKLKACFWSTSFVRGIGQWPRCATANGNRFSCWIGLQIGNVMQIEFRQLVSSNRPIAVVPLTVSEETRFLLASATFFS